MKNAWSKTRKAEEAYYVARMGDWTWYVLKAYQSSGKAAGNQYARVFCKVVTPMTSSFGDLGDVYVRDIPNYTQMLRVQAIDEIANAKAVA